MLNLRKGDRINYQVEDDGRVYIEAAREQEADPALGAFLDVLEADIKAHPERLRLLDSAFVERIQALVGNEHVDLDAPLSDDDE